MKKSSETYKKISQDGYCYCPQCDSIRYLTDLVTGEEELRCRICGSDTLTPPAWVCCPQIGFLSVNCPVGGIGVVKEQTRIYCNLYCSFRS